MNLAPKCTLRLVALIGLTIAILALPQLSRMSVTTHTKSVSAKTSQDPKPGQEAPSQNKEEAGGNPDAFMISIPENQRTKGKVNTPLRVSAITAQGEVEPNGTSATATPLGSASVKARGTVFPVNDVDFYSFTATAGDRIYAATQTLFDASASGDSVLDLLNTDGTTVIENDPNDGTFNASSSSIAGALIPASGTYFLRVRHNVATGTIRPYDLYFNRLTGAPVAEVEPNNTTGTATPLPASGWASGTVTAVSPGEADFYSITLAAGDTVYLSLDMNPERDASVWNGRLGFALFGNPPANQILLANDANAGASAADPNSEAFFFTVKDAGTYFVYVDSIVAAGLGASATYHLSAQVLAHAPATANCTTYTSTDVPVAIPTGPGMVSSTLTVPGNPRIADLDITINLNHTFVQDLDVHLVSPAGNDNGLFTDIGAATVGGAQTLFDLRIDDEAGLPPAFALSSSFVIQPELAFRLNWFDNENAGGTWTLVIRDDASGDGGTLNSWSITVCEPPAAPACAPGMAQTTVFTTDFESGDAGFTHSGAQDEWERGLPTFVPITTCNSGVNCWKTDLDSGYNASASQDLLSPPINLAGLSGPILLNWAMRYHIESANFDHAFVEAREVGNPANAVRVFEFLDATMNNTVGNPAVTINESAGWGQFSADISALAGLNIEVRFHLDSDTTVQLAGLAIDDVSVTACSVAACALTCPANITQTNDPNQCGAVVTYAPPTITGTCGTVTCSPASGSFFPIGTTTVTCTEAGPPPRGTGAATCSFTVTVTDDQAPSITCPANVTVSNTTDQCGAVVNYPPPTITDNCPGMFSATCTPASGSFFPVGTTTVTCEVDAPPPPTGAPAPAVVGGGCMTQTITHSSSQAITPLNSVSCNDGIGHTNNSYWRAFSLPAFSIATAFDVTSVDIGIEEATAGAVASAPKKGAAPAPPTGKGGQAGTRPKSFSKKQGTSAPKGGSQPITVNLYQSSMAFPAGFPGSLTLIGTANVNVTDQSGTILNVPITGTVTAGGELVVEVFTPDGQAAGNLFFIGSNAAAETAPSYISAADCGITVPTTTAAVGFPDMHIVMNVNGCPQGGGGGSSCSFTVTVNDTQAPTIVCPANVTAVTPACGGASSVITYTTPTGADNCPGTTVACVPPSGSVFALGVTTVTCTATDASGNTASCSFTVSLFNACIQDDNNPNTVLLWNTATGAYRFCCNGTVFTGVGVVLNKGNSHSISHAPVDKRIHGILDCSTGKGEGGLQSNAGSLICTINDRNINNNTCNCGGVTPAVGTQK